MEEQSKDLQDYLVAIRKRKTGILIIAIIVMLIATLVAFLLPPKYQSRATILIEQQEIPQELVMSTVTSYAAERIQVIQARVMSRANDCLLPANISFINSFISLISDFAAVKIAQEA